MTHNNLGFEFAYAVHAGDFTEFEPPFTEKAKEEEPPIIQPPPLTRTLTRTGYENSLPIEQEPTEDLLIRTEIENIDIDKELPWKLAD